MKLALLSWCASTLASQYDYIVVGSGPGGGTLATELALKKFNVLLIEAGPDYLEANETTPVFHGRASEDPAISFSFEVNHYDNDRKYFYPRAGVLGGCSLHNAQISVYSNSKDFQYMEEITGDHQWSEKNMRKYFVKMEDNQYPASFVSNFINQVVSNNFLNHLLPIKEIVSTLLPPLFGHGYDGWFPTSFIDLLRQLKVDSQLLDLALGFIGDPLIDINGYGLGHKLNTDIESRFFVPQAVDTDKFTRFNFQSHIKNVARTRYLTIMPDTFVTKILINDKNEAYGVEYRKGSYLYRASPLGDDSTREKAPLGRIHAKREVIISGGTFNTPQLLMLSGIGDQDHLNSFGIPVKQHLPGVGRNMMDRYEVSLVNKYEKKTYLLEDCLFIQSMEDPCYREYIENHSGPYISNGILAGELKRSSSKVDENDLFILTTISDFHGYYHGYSTVLANGLDSFTRLILKARTNNTNGYVRLQSTDPFDVPEINFKSFSDGDGDLDIVVQEIKNQRDYIQRHIHLPHVETVPGPKVKTDQQIRDFVLDQAWGHHACCTARIGKPEDPHSVLNSKFQVRGITNLRVVDASAIPRIPGYFPAIFIHTMAMKAADDIANDVYRKK